MEWLFLSGSLKKTFNFCNCSWWRVFWFCFLYENHGWTDRPNSALVLNNVHVFFFILSLTFGWIAFIKISKAFPKTWCFFIWRNQVKGFGLWILIDANLWKIFWPFTNLDFQNQSSQQLKACFLPVKSSSSACLSSWTSRLKNLVFVPTIRNLNVQKLWSCS